MLAKRGRLPSAFTLIELLVVIAIIAILIALLIPAVQKIREVAARTKCQNNMKQCALAMHSYHDAMKRLPYGSMWNPRTSWACQIYAYIDQKALAQQYDYTVGFQQPPNGGATGSTNNLVATQVPTYLCPSDRGSPAYWMGDKYYRIRGNYIVNWGNTTDPGPANPANLAPFSYTDGTTTPRKTKLSSITDGTSNTLLMSETIMAPDKLFDIRGDIINNDRGCFNFMTLNTPNSSAPDSLHFYAANDDPMMPSAPASNASNAARSRHTGGVNAALCDGSVRFITNNVPITTWAAMGSMNGNDLISDF